MDGNGGGPVVGHHVKKKKKKKGILRSTRIHDKCYIELRLEEEQG